jgi:hypothetical protein
MAEFMTDHIDIDTADAYPEQGAAVAQYQFLLRYMAYAAALVVGFSWFPTVVPEGITITSLFSSDGHDSTGQAYAALVSIGAALGAFRLAAQRFGHTAEIAIFPDTARPDIVAQIPLGTYHQPSLDDRLRFNALTASAAPCPVDENRALPQGLIRALPHLAAQPGTWVSAVAAASDRMRVRDCLRQAMQTGNAASGFSATSVMRNELVGPPDLATPGLFLLGTNARTPTNSVALGGTLQELVVLLHGQEVQARVVRLPHILGEEIMDALALPMPPRYMVAAAYGAPRAMNHRG